MDVHKVLTDVLKVIATGVLTVGVNTLGKIKEGQQGLNDKLAIVITKVEVHDVQIGDIKESMEKESTNIRKLIELLKKEKRNEY